MISSMKSARCSGYWKFRSKRKDRSGRLFWKASHSSAASPNYCLHSSLEFARARGLLAPCVGLCTVQFVQLVLCPLALSVFISRSQRIEHVEHFRIMTLPFMCEAFSMVRFNVEVV